MSNILSFNFFRVSALCFSAFFLFGVRPAFAQVEEGETEVRRQFVGAYLWGSSIGGETRSGTGITVGFDEIVDNLEMGFTFTYEMRKAKWSLLTDVIYMDISDDTTTTVNIPIGPGIPVTTSASADQTSWIVHLVGGYNLLTDGGSWLDLTAGVRYLEIDSNVDLTLAVLGPGQSVTLSESDSVWDGIIGLKGRVALGERWHLPYYFDIGTGDSDFTWQAIVGVSFQATKSVNVAFVYRHLEWEFASDSLVNDLYFSGPALGVTFHF